MLNERSNMLYDDKQLFKSYKKFYNDDILFLEWQEQVEKAIHNFSVKQKQNLIESLRVKCDKICDRDEAVSDVIFVVVVPIFICYINLIPTIFGQAMSMYEKLIDVVGDQVEIQKVADIIKQAGVSFTNFYINIVTRLIVFILFYIIVYIVIKQKMTLRRRRRKRYYVDMIAILKKGLDE